MNKQEQNLFIALTIMTLSLVCAMFTNHFALLAWAHRLSIAMPEPVIDFWQLTTYFFMSITIASLGYFVKFAINIELGRRL